MAESKSVEQSLDRLAVKLISDSNIINPAATIESIMALTGRIVDLYAANGVVIRGGDTFIHPNYVYKHEN